MELNTEIGYDFKYMEDIVSAFFQYNYAWNKWSFVGGIRGEYTSGNVQNVNDRRNSFNLFPSLFIDYTLNEENKLSFSYTRRINRVSFMRLLPNRYFLSAYNIIEGNPNLLPNINNTLSLNYNLKSKYYFSASYSWSNNGITSFSKSEQSDNHSYIVSTYIDGIKSRNFNFNAYVPIYLTKWWSMVNRFSMDYQKYMLPDNPTGFTTFGYDYYLNQNIKMNKTTMAEILYRYSSESRSAYTISSPYHLLNLSLQKTFLDNSLILKAEANRILNNQRMSRITTTPEIVEKVSMHFVNIPYFALTLSYKFNRGKVKRFNAVQNSNSQDKARTY